MKLVVTLIITLGAAIGFALIAIQDPGYVVVARAPYTVRLPLALFVLAVIVVFAALYLLFNAIAAVLGAPKRFRAWRERRNEARAQLYTMRGYAGLIEGDWAKAEKKLLTHLPHTKAPLLNYLGAAYAAQQRGHLQRRDQYLADALSQHPDQRLAVGLTAARLHYQAGEIAVSRDVLEKLTRAAPNNVPAVRLLAAAYRELQDWNSLTALLPSLTRLKAFPPEELAAWEKHAYGRYLSSPALLQGGDGRPTQAFRSLPAARRKAPVVIAGYCRQLLRAGERVLAEKTLRIALNRQWDAQLADLYGKTETPFTGDQIKLVKSWMKKYGPHAELTLALARLYRRDRQGSKARECFAEAIADGCEQACAELGGLLEEMGETDAALACYRQGLAALGPELGAAEPPSAPSGELVTPRSPGQGSGSGALPVVR